MTVPVSPNPKTLANKGKGDAVLSVLEQRVQDAILYWDADHEMSRAAEVVALVAGAIADEIQALWDEEDCACRKCMLKLVRGSVSPPLAGDRQ